jgi:hypothetical protein
MPLTSAGNSRPTFSSAGAGMRWQHRAAPRHALPTLPTASLPLCLFAFLSLYSLYAHVFSVGCPYAGTRTCGARWRGAFFSLFFFLFPPWLRRAAAGASSCFSTLFSCQRMCLVNHMSLKRCSRLDSLGSVVKRQRADLRVSRGVVG